MEYRRERRGPEKHVKKLKNDKEGLQRLMLSYMQKYKLLNRKAFVWDMDRLRSKLKKDVKAELSTRSGNAILQDRQIEQFAILITVYHWLYAEYREDITSLYYDAQKAENEIDNVYRNELKQVLEDNISEVEYDRPLYKFVKQQTVSTAVSAAQHNPFTDYIETIGTLIEAGDITDHHFNWMDDGTLKIWAKAVWDKYLAAKRGTDDVVRRDLVEEKLKEMSDLDNEGGLKLVNWTPPSAQALDDSKKIIRAKGFYIPRANENVLLAQGFQVHKFNPAAYINPNAHPPAADKEEANNTGDKQANFTDKLPF